MYKISNDPITTIKSELRDTFTKRKIESEGIPASAKVRKAHFAFFRSPKTANPIIETPVDNANAPQERKTNPIQVKRLLLYACKSWEESWVNLLSSGKKTKLGLIKIKCNPIKTLIIPMTNIIFHAIFNFINYLKCSLTPCIICPTHHLAYISPRSNPNNCVFAD